MQSEVTPDRFMQDSEGRIWKVAAYSLDNGHYELLTLVRESNDHKSKEYGPCKWGHDRENCGLCYFEKMNYE